MSAMFCFPRLAPREQQICVPIVALIEQWPPPPDPEIIGREELEEATTDLRVLATVDRAARYAGDDLRHALHSVTREYGAAIAATLSERYGVEVHGAAGAGSAVG
jgi:hypothetical protein